MGCGNIQTVDTLCGFMLSSILCLNDRLCNYIIANLQTTEKKGTELTMSAVSSPTTMSDAESNIIYEFSLADNPCLFYNSEGRQEQIKTLSTTCNK